MRGSRSGLIFQRMFAPACIWERNLNAKLAAEVPLVAMLGCVDAAPSRKAPRQIPSCIRRRALRDIVDAGRAPGLAAQQPRQRHPAARPQTETRDGLVGIHRAGGQMPALVADQRRQRVAVDPDQAAAGETGQANRRDMTVATR